MSHPFSNTITSSPDNCNYLFGRLKDLASTFSSFPSTIPAIFNSPKRPAMSNCNSDTQKEFTHEDAPSVSKLSLPFAHLNLRFNPFGEMPLEKRALLAIVEIDDVLSELRDDSVAFQFIGDRGRGKTTHLMAIKSHFQQSAYVHIPEDSRPPIPIGNPLFVDEIQRLNWFQRAKIFRRKVPLVLGTHTNYETQLRVMGRRAITIEVGGRLDGKKLQRITQHRIEHARRDSGAVPRLTPETINFLIDRYQDDVRAIEGHLYDVFQQLKEPGHV